MPFRLVLGLALVGGTMAVMLDSALEAEGFAASDTDSMHLSDGDVASSESYPFE